MKMVRRSKDPTVQQLLNMAANLRKKFNKSSLVKVEAWHHIAGRAGEVGYRIYVEDTISENFKSWKDCQSYYFNIMEAP